MQNINKSQTYQKWRTVRYKAVTFAELIIVMAIIGIMTAVSIVSFTPIRSSARLKAAQREVAAEIKLAQGYALQGKTQKGATPCGYGFHFKDNSNYEIFYNAPNGAGDTCGSRNSNPSNLKFVNGYSSSVEAVTLKEGVILKSDPSKAQIYFTVPHANIFDENGSSFVVGDVKKTFVFGFSSPSLPDQKSIDINSGGFVTEN